MVIIYIKIWPEYFYTNQSVQIRTFKSINENRNLSWPLPFQGNKLIPGFYFKKISKRKSKFQNILRHKVTFISISYILKSLDNEDSCSESSFCVIASFVMRWLGHYYYIILPKKSHKCALQKAYSMRIKTIGFPA